MADLTVNPLTPASSTPVTANSTPNGIPPVPTYSATNPVTASPNSQNMNLLTPSVSGTPAPITPTPVAMPTVSPNANYQAVTAPSTPLQQPTPSIIATTQATAPQTQGMAQTALQTTQDYIAKQQVTPEQATSNNIFDSLKNSLMSSDGSAGISSREMQTRADLGQQYNTIGITQQLATLTPQINAISQQIQANNQQAAAAKLSILSSPIGGLTQADYSGRQTEIDRNNAIKNLSLSAQSNVLASQALILQGNLDGASKAIELAITQRYGAEEAKIKDQQALMTLNQPRLEAANSKATANQTLLLNAAKEDLTNKREQAKNFTSDVNTLISKFVINDPQAIQNAYKVMGDVANGTITTAEGYRLLGIAQNINGDVSVGTPGTNGASFVNGAVGNPAQRNNNPGNLKKPDGSWQTFATPQLGFLALQQDLTAKMTGATSTGLTANSTLLDFAKKYAPSTDNNDPNAYAKNLAQQMNVSINTTIGSLQPRVADFAKAIAQNEGYNNALPTKGTAGTTGSPSIDATQAGYYTKTIGGTGMTQAGIDTRAMSIATGNETAPKQGSGITGVANRAINNRVGELLAGGGNVAGNKAELKSLTSTLTEQTKYVTNITRSLANAESGFSQITQAFSNKGLNTNESAFANSKVNAVNKFFGNNTEALRAFQTGLYEVQNEYAQVFARGGQRSVEGNKEAAALLSGDISIKDLMSIQNELKAQGEIVKGGSEKIVSDTQQKINNIIAPKTDTTHSGYNLPTTTGNTYSGFSLPK